MTFINRQLRQAALSISTMFGRFGDYEQTEDAHKAIIRGLHKFSENHVSLKKRHKKTGTVKGHRRSYLCGKPGMKHI